VRTLAAALVAARKGDAAMRSKVIAVLRQLPGLPTGRELALGRELGAYVLAADLVKSTDAEVGYDQKAFYQGYVTKDIHPSDGPATLKACHEQRPNNWGTWCGATRVAIDRYVGDQADLLKAATIFRGWLGERSSYAGFTYGDTSWQADPSKPVGVNAQGTAKSGRNVDGILPDDQRRSGSFTWPPACENYVWEALQGATLEAELLARAGYDSWKWSDAALERALGWLYGTTFKASADRPAGPCTAIGDDTSVPWLVNHATGSSFPTTAAASIGKAYGFGDWLWP
jgi:hypothetical protein